MVEMTMSQDNGLHISGIKGKIPVFLICFRAVALKHAAVDLKNMSVHIQEMF